MDDAEDAPEWLRELVKPQLLKTTRRCLLKVLSSRFEVESVVELLPRVIGQTDLAVRDSWLCLSVTAPLDEIRAAMDS